MKKIFAIIALMAMSFVAYAGPIEELTAAFKAEQEKNADKVQPMGAGVSVLRAYLATTSGFQAITSGNTTFPYLIPKSVLQSTVVGLSFVALPSQGTLDIYAGSAGTQYAGFILLVYYDATGSANEIYLTNTRLP
jgi:hypothetical protein